jgi:uncharacterized protein YlxP (DUF503 family)
MIVGILELELRLFDAMSLKDKRRVVKSLKDRISNKYNVSVAEVADADSIGCSVLGIAMVANEKRFVESVLYKIFNFVERCPQLSLTEYHIEMV